MSPNQLDNTSIIVNSLKSDVEVIKRDITHISRVYNKVDDVLEKISDIVKKIAVQDKSLEIEVNKLHQVEETLKKYDQNNIILKKELNERFTEIITKQDEDREKRHKEILEAIDKMNTSFTDKIKEQNETIKSQDIRINSLEKWKWYIFGIAAFTIFFIEKILPLFLK